ncbi:PREDICTED: uncharacterized protein LOC108366211 [Rhagoletis zephyria]|uniref:uncharacterized protein LOC108366211 n=1 Tax=Rhagoletis zephyria TaxID=28612 RepID=UPI000811942D|nr:PREDICTED: uncharacterized protein LOC108366211 [Rhagoletis zephyria]
MKYKHGEHKCTRLKYYSNHKQKLAKQIEQLKFLLECKKFELTPKHLTKSVKNTTINSTSQNIKQKIEKTKQIFLMKMLNIEITQTNMNMRAAKNNLHHTEIQLKRTLSESEFIKFIQKQNLLCNKIAKEKESTLTSKIEKIKQERMRKLGININDNWFANKTSIVFPQEVK